jgi:hypothetical protein
MRSIITTAVAVCFSCTAVAESAIYANLDSGWAEQSGLPTANNVGASSLDHRVFPSVWSADIGYNHDFSDNVGLGAEAGAGLFGKATYQFSNGKSTAESSVISFMGQILGHYKPADIILKMGLARVNLDVTGLNKGSRSRPHFEIGFGGAYKFNAHFALQAIYLHIFGGNLTSLANLTDTPKINAVLTGLRITF